MTLKSVKAQIAKNITKITKERFYDINSARILCEESIALCEANQIEPEKGILFSLLGDIYYLSSRYDEGVSYIFKAIQIFDQHQMLENKSRALRYIGNVQFDLGDYEIAFDYYNQSLDLEAEANSTTYKATALNNIGEIYKYLKQYKEAQNYYERSYQIEQQHLADTSLGVVLINLAETSYLLNQYDKGMDYILLAEQTFEVTKGNYFLSEAYKVKAQLQWKLGYIEEADHLFKKAIDFCKSFDYYYGQIEIYLSYQEFLMSIGQTDQAIIILLDTYVLSAEKAKMSKVTTICYQLATVFDSVGNEAKANLYYRLYAKYNHEIEELHSLNVVKNIEFRKNMNQVQKDKLKLQLKNERLEESVKSLTIIGELGQKITSTLDLNEITAFMLDTLEQFFELDGFGICLYHEEDQRISYDYCIEKGVVVSPPDTYLSSKNSFAAYCLRNQEMIVLNDLENDYSKYIERRTTINTTPSATHSVIYSPLIFDDRKVGVLTIQSYEKDYFQDYHITIINAICSYSAIAITNALNATKLKREIEVRKHLNVQLDFLARNDGLTGIPNRRSFEENIERLWAEGQETKTKLSLVFIDIDYFKEYNDHYGHVEGDYCISLVATLLVNSLEKDYFVARYGGDEFVMLLPGADSDTAYALSEKIRHLMIEQTFTNVQSKIASYVTLTLGITSTIPSANLTIKEFIRQADTALYEGKKKGKNTSVVYKP